MKRLLIFASVVLALLAFSPIPSAFADWSVTATWTRSIGPSLDYEECQLDGAVQCTIQETDPTTCTFIVANLTGQEVKIRSFNTQGAYADYVIGTLLAVPAPATGGNLVIVYIP